MVAVPEAIISIRPKFASAILSGDKKVELRRRIPVTQAGTRLWIYATKPTAAIVGHATVEHIIQSPPNKLWKDVGKDTGVTRTIFDEYFHGTDVAIALVLSSVRRVSPISIERLREIRPGFHPPQVMVRITESESRLLRAHPPKPARY